MEHQFSELYFNKAITALQVSDIPNLSQLKSTDDYRSLGNGFYKNDQYCQALCVYSKGLMLNPTSVVLLANKAKTFLKVSQF